MPYFALVYILSSFVSYIYNVAQHYFHDSQKCYHFVKSFNYEAIIRRTSLKIIGLDLIVPISDEDLRKGWVFM